MGHLTVVDAALTLLASSEELDSAGVESAVEVGDEGERIVRQDLVEMGFQITEDFDTGRHERLHGASVVVVTIVKKPACCKSIGG